MITTPNLTLVPATPKLLAAELDGLQNLGEALGADIPEDWPPGEYERSAAEYLLLKLSKFPEFEGWLGYYAVTNLTPVVAAFAGYFGPPDDAGAVEIGYSVAESCRRRGYAGEIIAALAQHAFAQGAASVAARTRKDNEPSMRALLRCGFFQVPYDDPDLLKFETRRAKGNVGNTPQDCASN